MKFNPNIHYLGKLCRHDHDYEESGMSLRYIKTLQCVECVQEATARSNARHKERRKAYHKQWIKDNPEKNRERMRRYRNRVKRAMAILKNMED